MQKLSVLFLAACSLAFAQGGGGFFQSAGEKMDQGSKVVAEKVSDGSVRTAHVVKDSSVAVATTNSHTAQFSKAAAQKVAHLFKR